MIAATGPPPSGPWWAADTDTNTHADVVPLDLPVPADAAVGRINAVVASLPRWRVESSDAGQNTTHATHRTRLWRFVDDVNIRVEPTATGVRVHARSQSRVGKGDMGQNRRNILGLFDALRKRLGNA